MVYFKDREEAAQKLLDKLLKYRGKNVIVAGIPRGAMPMAKIIADGLGAELSAVLVHKIPHPFNEELAIGCIGISGKIHLLDYIKYESISSEYIHEAAKEQLDVLIERKFKYGLKDISMKDKTVIIVDDGIATGATTICAAKEVRALGAKKIVLAAAVSSTDAAEKLKPLVDEFVVMATPSWFYGVGQFFSYFPQVSDDTVIEMLQGERSTHV